MWALCNLIDKKEGHKNYKYIGYIIQTQTSPPKYTFHIDNSMIEWPTIFNGKQPRTYPIITTKISVKSSWLVFTLSILSVILIIASIIFGILLVIWRHKDIIKSASWTLCLLMCIGCILGYITVILFGIDEAHISYDERTWKNICNLRVLFGMSSLIFGFGPLFAKTYRISKICDAVILNSEITPDSHLLKAIITFYMIEITLCVIYIFTGGEYREYIYGEVIETNDVLEQQYMIYGTCAYANDSIGQTIFYIISVLIIAMFIYGLYLASKVLKSRVKLSQFNEALEVSVSILISASLIVITAPFIMVIDINSQIGVNLKYAFQAGCIIISFTISLFTIILTRLIIICRGKENEYVKADLKYLSDATTNLERKIRDDLNKIHQALLNRKLSKRLSGTATNIVPTNILTETDTYDDTTKLITSNNNNG